MVITVDARSLLIALEIELPGHYAQHTYTFSWQYAHILPW